MSQKIVRIVVTRQCLMQGEVFEVGKTIELSEHAAKQLIHAGKAIIEPIKTMEQKNIEIEVEQSLKKGSSIEKPKYSLNPNIPANEPIFNEASNGDDDASHDGATKYDDWTLKQLQTELNDRSIPYHSRASKAELLALLVEESKE